MACSSRAGAQDGGVYLAVPEGFVVDVRPGADQPHPKGVQHHPLAPGDHSLRQVAPAQTADRGSKASGNILENNNKVTLRIPIQPIDHQPRGKTAQNTTWNGI